MRLRLPASVAVTPELKPNAWDALLLPVAFAVFALLAFGAAQMAVPYDVGEPIPLSLDPANLPYYLLRSALRMLAALAVSFAFTLPYGLLAAKIPALERVLIPVLDILQSIPVLGFLSITVTGFIAMFPGSLLGVECAAIFAIFTSQAWNMAFSLYQSLRTVPADLKEAADMFHLSAWQRFWRLEFPYAVPGLVWNMMMSVSGGWFFVVASEAISVSGQDILLPGVGSYIALAIQAQDLSAIGWAILSVIAGILVYDQLMFRPLVAWAAKFKFEQSVGEEVPQSWLLTLMQRARLSRAAMTLPIAAWDAFAGMLPRRPVPDTFRIGTGMHLPHWADAAWNAFLLLATAAGSVQVALFVHSAVGLAEVGQVMLYGLYTTIRITVLMIAASLFWVPVGVWMGLRPRVAQNVQWVAQFLAAFPANLVFPVAVLLIVRFDLNVDVWTSPLMVLGTQWYLLFNVVAGASQLPSDLRDTADNLGLKGWLWWKKFVLPGIFPSYLTGAVTATCASWNASIVAEMVSWGDTKLVAHGLGAYIAEATAAGDFPRIALGIGAMCIYVMAFNHFLWRPLCTIAAERAGHN
ncbi:MAG: ABC transporter permease [Actinomycetota bacterium]